MALYEGFDLFESKEITTNDDGTFTIRGNTAAENVIFRSWIDDLLGTSAGTILSTRLQALGTISIRAVPLNKEFPDYQGMAINDAAYSDHGAMNSVSSIDGGSGGGSRFNGDGEFYPGSTDTISINLELGSQYLTVGGAKQTPADNQIVFLHELMHAVNRPSINSGAYRPQLDAVNNSSAYEEQIAIFYSNYLAQSLGLSIGERVGHSSSGTGASKSAVSYLLGTTAASYRFVGGNLEAGFRTADGGSILKTYVMGNNPGTGSLEATFGADVVEIRYSASSLSEQKMNDILEQSAVENSDPLQFLKDQIAEQNERGEHQWVLNAQQLLVASGERMVSQGVDVEGPRPDFANGNFIQLTAGSTQSRTIIFGSAGWQGIGSNSAKATSEFQAIDKLTGGDGNDWIVSFSDRDGNELDGGSGDDFVVGSDKNDILRGGDGLFSSGDDALIGRDGDDDLIGGGGDDELTGGDGADKLYGGLGDDTLFGDTDDVELDGGLGHDKVDYRDSDVAIDWAAANAKIDGIEEIIGSDFDDVLEMPTSVSGQLLDSDLIIDGGKGDDKIRGTELANELRGGEGDDTILGKGGADVIEGGDGDDLLVGGDDSYTLWPDDDELRGGAGDDRLSGGDGDDKLYGGADKDGLLGGKGKDLLHGEEGDDLLAGGESDDELYGDGGNDGLVGDDGDDRLFGGIGDDTLVGSAGADILNGEGGNDILDASQGDSEGDILKGGGESDTFIVNSGDKILDLEKGDKIILGGQYLVGGEKTTPPANPCDPTPPQPEDDDGTYKGSNGAVYELSGSTLTISFGGQSIVLDHFRNGDGGINLRPDRSRQDQAECKRDPLILDLNGDRDVYDKLADSNAYFDLDNDGFAEHVAWAQKGDGLLVFDRNANGLIDDGTELFGSNYSQRTGGAQHEIGANGFADLTNLDSNGDYKITAADLDFAKLQVWIDADGDGVTQDGELKSLGELGIVSISLASRTSDAEVCGCDGTTVPLMSDVLRADGTSVRIYDAYLAIDQYDTRELNPIEVPAEFRDLPFLIGSGTLSDLDVAMTKDPALEQLVREFAGLDASRASEIPELVEQIVLRWTGADTVAADSRGWNINAQWLAALEKLSGSEFYQALVGPNPRGDAASILIDDWDAIINRFTAELLGQTSLGAELMPGLEFAGAASFQVVEGTSLSSVIDSLAAHAPTGTAAEQVKYWHAMTATLTKYSRDFAVIEAEIYAAIDAVPAVQALGLSASQLANLRITDGVTGRNIGTGMVGLIGTGSAGLLASGADVLFADVANAELRGFDGNDVYVLTSDATGTTLKDTNGFDRLVLIDQSRDSITATARMNGSWGHDRIVVTLADEATGWTLDLEGRIVHDMLVLDIDWIDFSDLKGVPVVDLLPAEIYTPSGQRVYYGSNQDVSLLGGAGDDLIIGTGTADRYQLNATSGQDKINDRGTGEGATSSDRLVIDAPLESVTFEIAGAAGESLIVRNDEGQSVTIVGQWNRDNGIEFFDFSDGTSLTAQEVNALLLAGTAGSDQINGTRGDDLIDGHGGADVLSGNYGSDTYVFNRGYGFFTISDPLGLNRIQFGADIAQNDISIERRADGLLISVIGTSDAVFVQGGRSYQDVTLDFTSGSVSVTDLILSLASPDQLPVDGIIRGTSKTDYDVSGTEGNDIIDGLGGDEWLSGYEGDDTYLFGGSGEKEIFEDDGFDVIRLAPDLTFDTFVFLAGMITFEGTDGYVAIDNWWQTDGTLYTGRPGDFVEGLIFADGRTFNLASDKVTIGGDGDDILFNFGTINDTFSPGKGNDRIFASNPNGSSNNGTKTVILERDFGHDVLYPGTNFKLDLTAFTLDTSTALRRDGDDLVVSTDNGANDIRVKRVFEFVTSGFGQSSIVFAGGVTLTMANVIQRITVATTGNDILFGRTTLDGGAGDDVLIGDRLVNEYRFGKGYGHDVIKERTTNSSEYSVQDTLTLVGLNRSDVTISRDRADPKTILITIKETGETVRLDGTPLDDFRYLDPEDNYNPNGADDFGAHWVERIVFANGEVLSQKQIEQMLLDGEATAGDDIIELFGAPWRASVDGTYVDGGAGNDIYRSDYATANIRWSAASGSDRLISTAGFFRDCKIKLNGIQAKDVLVTVEQRDGEPHYILRAHDGSELAIPGIYRDLFIIAEDGTQYQVKQAGPLVENLVATDGDDWMRGRISGTWTSFHPAEAYTDTFDGGAGNDVIAGYGASDTVFFGRGDGQDVLLDSIVMGFNNDKPQTYTISFKAGVTREDVTIEWTKDGSGNLKISIIGTEDSIIMSPHNFVALNFADGRVVRSVSIGDGAEIIDLKALRPAATDGDDVLFVDANQTIDGGAGDDVIYHLTETNSWSGRATVMFGRGSGNDIFGNTTAVPLYNGGYLLNNQTNHTVHLKGIESLDEVRLIKSGADLIIEIKDTGERLTIKNQLLRELSNDWIDMPVSTIRLDSGDSFYFPWLQDMIIGDDYAGNDEIETGTMGGVLDGGSGNDVLKGSTGDDSYVFGRGYDEDRVVDAGGSADRVLFQDGVAATDVVFSRVGANGNDLLIEILGDDRLTMTIANQFGSEGSRIENFVFADGEMLSWADAQQAILDGLTTSAADIINGFAAADQIEGGAGGDQLKGLGGNDQIDGGAGRDTAILSGSSSEYRITTVDGVTTIEDLVQGRDGVDLLINVEDLRFLGDNSNISLTAANSAPVVQQGSAATAEDAEIIIARADVMGLASDADGDALTLAVGGATNGQAWIDRDGNVHFRPTADYAGAASFDYTISDGNGGSSTATYAITVAAHNDAPRSTTTSLGDMFANEDGAIAITLPADLFQDPDGGEAGLSLAMANGDPAPAWLSIQNGVVAGTPPANFNGQLALAVIASDGELTASVALNLTILARNDAPNFAADIDTAEVRAGVPFELNFGTQPFQDVDGDAVAVSISLADGSLMPEWLSYANGVLSGTPPTGFEGLDLVLTGSDGRTSTKAYVTLETPLNRAPDVVNPMADTTSNEDQPVDILVPSEVFQDLDGDVLSFTMKQADGTSLPSWLSYGDGRLTGTPPPNYHGELDLVLTANDGSLSASDSFRLTIASVNDAPIVALALIDRMVSAVEAVDFTVPADTFSDADGDALQLSATLANGDPLPTWLSFTNGHFFGQAPAGYSGELLVNLSASDGTAVVNDQFSLNILKANEAPTANDDQQFFTVQGHDLLILQEDLLINDTDPNGDVLTILSLGSGSHGVVSLDADGKIRYSPDGSFSGSDQFTYTITDGEFTSTALISVRVESTFADWGQGTAEDDRLFGNHSEANRLLGLAGDDHVKGGTLEDRLAGDEGADHIQGLSGNDHLWGGAGDDKLLGGEGFDTAYFMGARSSYSVVTANGVVSVVDNASGIDGNDGQDEIGSIELLSFRNGETVSVTSPIILDLDGNGVQTVSASRSRARFDMNGDGRRDDTSWISRGDGFLFLDRDGNGTVTNIGEMSFTNDMPGAVTDLDGLRAFDSNNDGILSAADARFTEFKVWRDANGDGQVGAHEILGLDQIGLSSLNLSGVAHNSTVALGDVAVVNTGSWTRTDGTTMEFADAAMTFYSGEKPRNRPAIERVFDRLREHNLLGGERPRFALEVILERFEDFRGVAVNPDKRWPCVYPALDEKGGREIAVHDQLFAEENVAPGEMPHGAGQVAAMVQDMAAFGVTPAGRIEQRPWTNVHPDIFVA